MSPGYLGFVAVGPFDPSAIVAHSGGHYGGRGPVTGAPIGVVLIVFEFIAVTNLRSSHSAVSMSSFISTRLFCYSFFDRQLIARGFDLRQGREFLSLKDISVSDLKWSAWRP